MSHSASGQKLYCPLKQQISDSESEEELHSGRGNRIVLLETRGVNTVCPSNNLMNGHTNNNKTEMQHEERTADGKEHASSVDNVNLIPQDTTQKMSPTRKVAFVFSILLCFLTVAVFLWVVPCGRGGECSAAGRFHASKGGSSWENSYTDMELKGAISVVSGAAGREKNLVLLFRGDIINTAHAEGGRESSDSGVVQLVGISGKVGWFVTQPRLPTDIDCTLLDVNKDGVKDCIFIGDDGLLAALDPTWGTAFWYLHYHLTNTTSYGFSSVDFPLVILDLDGDGVNELLTSCTVEKGNSLNQNSLMLVSGGSGSVMGQPILITQCTSINKLQIDENHMISYTCRNNTTLAESLKVISLEDLYRVITNKPYNREWSLWPVSRQHPVFGQRREIENQRNVYSIDGRKLIVENQGHCPQNCKVSVQLVDERLGKENVSWQYTASQVYGMVPATLLFNNSANSSMLKHHISGFVLKFWQWNANIRGTGNSRFDRNTDSTFNIFNNAGDGPLPSGEPIKPVSERSKPTSNITANRLTERVVLVTFNATDFHIVNASQSDVFQICHADKKICQPDLAHQENSLLIADIDGDGSQELITYLTTFICGDLTAVEEIPHQDVKCNDSWRLHSTVRVVRLEAELPKLYEAVSHH